MSNIKAYAINAIKAGKTTHPASTKERPSIFDTDDDTFKRLEKLGAVRKPTTEERALFKAQQEALGNGESIDDVEVPEASTGGSTQAPASGAKDDPKGKPKGASDKDDLGV